MEYTLSGLSRIVGLKPRTIQLWADAHVIEPDPVTDRSGSGVHRKFSEDEAIVACMVAPFARLKTAIGMLIEVGTAMRRWVKLARRYERDRERLDAALRGDGDAHLVVYWRLDDKGEYRLAGTKMESGEIPASAQTWPNPLDIVMIHVIPLAPHLRGLSAEVNR